MKATNILNSHKMVCLVVFVHAKAIILWSRIASTPSVGMARGKMVVACKVYKSYVQNSALDVVISLYEPYQSFPSVFISIRTVSVARDHRWSTTPARR